MELQNNQYYLSMLILKKQYFSRAKEKAPLSGTAYFLIILLRYVMFPLLTQKNSKTTR